MSMRWIVWSLVCLLRLGQAQRNGGSGRQLSDRPVVYPDDTGGVTYCRTSNGESGVCSATNNCPVYRFSTGPAEHCLRGVEQMGVCCPFRMDSQPPMPPGQTSENGNAFVAMPDITINDIDDSGREGMDYIHKVELLEKELVSRGLTVKPGTTAAFHQAFFGNKELAQRLAKSGHVGLETTIEILKKFNLNPTQGRDGLARLDLSRTQIGQTICPRRMTMCPRSKYRSMDGSCNNLQNPDWGKSFTPFQRFMLPRYADGVNLPRIASDGGPLPGPRQVSSMSNPDADIPHRQFTLIVMQWAQFLDHDLTVATINRASDGEGIKCCDEEILRNPRLRHPECMEIPIPKEDTFYARFGQTCMEFVRSAPAPRETCTLGPREQMNQLTAFLDGSQIYGSTREDSMKLRSFSGGRLLTLRFNDADLLPRETNRSEECAQRQTDLFCFMAGDERVNEQNGLTAMHTIWMREHNRIAGELSSLNPRWTDEIIFQETRRIIGAEIQHITYNEFLPLLIGRKMMKSFGLLLEAFGHGSSYEPDTNPSIANGFATAAYRYGHTLVQGTVQMVERDGSIGHTVSLHSQFFNPLLIYGPGNLDRFLRGLTRQPVQTYDRFVTSSLTNHLFEIPGRGFGLDLIALNVQRGRDHGVPPYNAWREHCGLKKMTSFQDLEQIMTPQSARSFASLYRSVDDIDLFPGGVAERSLPDGTLGPTFACIVSEQFRRIKVGDRFFYHNGGMDTSFSEAQLNQLRNANLARIVCDNSDDIGQMQPLAFIQPAKEWNPLVSCSGSQIPRLVLDAWMNEPV